MAKKIILLILISASIIYGTGQTPDYLLYNGKKYEMSYQYPLDVYLKNKQINFSKLITKYYHLNYIYISSGCYRGYIANWIISSNKLFLIRLQEPRSNHTVPLAIIFSNSSERVLANWYTDFIDLVEYHSNYSSISFSRNSSINSNVRRMTPWDSEINISIKNGQIIKIIKLKSNVYAPK